MGFSINIFSPSFNLFSISPAIKPSNYEYYHKKILYTLNQAICYNQGAYTQYAYLAGEKHKEMKEEFNKQDRDNDKLKEYRDKLEKHLYDEMIKAFRSNFKYIKDYFSERRKLEPRVCIKLYEKNAEIDEKEIVDFLRDIPLPQSPNYSIESNTGFFEVYKTGKSFKRNNIPYEVIQNRYGNPRLDDRKASRYKLSPFEQYKVHKLQKNDEKWINCWYETENPDGSRNRPIPEACYKSTMIIPMTLLGNDLYPQFRERFNIDTEDERAIYGFLCFDHHTINYFEEEPDRFIGYMFADIMSLYQITQLIYTDLSKTYRKVAELLDQQYEL